MTSTRLVAGPKAGKPLRRADIPERVAARFWQGVDRSNPKACWIWPGLKAPTGYGICRWQTDHRTTRLRAHRVAFALAVSDIPVGLVVGHLCDQPTCVNPDHLWLGTQAANVLDTVMKGRHRNTAARVCRSGHPFDDVNTYTRPDGARGCKICRRAAVKRSRAKR